VPRSGVDRGNRSRSRSLHQPDHPRTCCSSARAADPAPWPGFRDIPAPNGWSSGAAAANGARSIGAVAGSCEPGEQQDGVGSAAPVISSARTSRSMVGPVLNGLIGRKAGTIKGFKYSEANKSSGIVWDAATFRDYIKNPKAKIPNTKMVFLGVATRRISRISSSTSSSSDRTARSNSRRLTAARRVQSSQYRGAVMRPFCSSSTGTPYSRSTASNLPCSLAMSALSSRFQSSSAGRTPKVMR
jgi:cytochrome c